ncbi:bifunctional 2-polyprenyl-6-hydroxyphenol methylase/3-demethylubiquinol 3-O-methyltransferase UbiG [Cyanobium sp. To12R1]|uniref:class I SAM-dependent methyltransferase n=1 Tax=Cyanobium sp. To12R1 TaxID=2823723 RepID=UPI0020CD378D|nr:class I SAM-dependent methyltransferase [Cyanobium sp. To12R1]MCP9781694.1 class I SAM-dependent methyltransferase [Cyanobium sp. To12R1]
MNIAPASPAGNVPAYTPVYHRDLSRAIDGKYQVVYDMLIPGSRVLEVGCSSGYFGEYLIQHGFEVVGIEFDEAAAAIARDKGLHVVSGDVQQADLIAEVVGTFDAILIMDVLEHIARPDLALTHLVKRLRPGGRLIVSGPNVAYWHIRTQLARGRWRYEDAGIMDKTHVRFYTIETWKELLDSSGLSFVSMRAAEGMLPKEQFYRNLVPNYNGLKKWLKKRWPTVFGMVIVFEYINS